MTEGPVVAKPGSLPLDVAVSQVVVGDRRLWVLLKAEAGRWQPAASPRRKARRRHEALAFAMALLLLAGVAVFLYWRSRPPALPPPPTAAELQALSDRRDALQARLRDAVVASGEKSLGEAPAET